VEIQRLYHQGLALVCFLAWPAKVKDKLEHVFWD